jgi:hypothetical protein
MEVSGNRMAAFDPGDNGGLVTAEGSAFLHRMCCFICMISLQNEVNAVRMFVMLQE